MTEGAASAWLRFALPNSPIVLVEHAASAMGIGDESVIAYRVDTIPPAKLRAFTGTEATIDVTGDVATMNSCETSYEQHRDGKHCADLPAQRSTFELRWVDGALVVNEHLGVKP